MHRPDTRGGSGWLVQWLDDDTVVVTVNRGGNDDLLECHSHGACTLAERLPKRRSYPRSADGPIPAGYWEGALRCIVVPLRWVCSSWSPALPFSGCDRQQRIRGARGSTRSGERAASWGTRTRSSGHPGVRGRRALPTAAGRPARPPRRRPRADRVDACGRRPHHGQSRERAHRRWIPGCQGARGAGRPVLVPRPVGGPRRAGGGRCRRGHDGEQPRRPTTGRRASRTP